MTSKILDKLKQINPWHFIWISIVCSEFITFVLSYVQGRIWWGGVSRETLIIGAVDAMVVPLIVASIVIYFVKHTEKLERLNARLQEANLKLQEIDKLKTDFITVVSHELRTPLTTVKAFVELIVMKPEMPGPRKERLLQAANVEADRLSRLINDLLDLSMIETGSMKWRMMKISIVDIIENSIASMGPLFENKGLRLTTAFSVPQAGLIGDRDRLVQVVTNILSNAVKFTPEGGGIHITARHDPAPAPQVVVEISDTGIGIPDGDTERIFEKFRRSSGQLDGAIEGTGLGLAIARQIVERHGGRIWAESAIGAGSTFSFTLPLNGKA